MNGIQYAIDLVDRTFGKTIKQAKQQTKGLDNAVKQTNTNLKKAETTGSNTFRGISKWAKRAAVGVASVFAVGKAFAFGNEITALEAKFEGFENAISFASGTEASKNFQFLDANIKNLNLDVTSSYKGFQTLSGSLKGTKLEGQGVRDIFEGVSIAATSMNLSSDQAEGAFLALSQMASKGKVQAEELRGQLGERIPGALNIAANAMGVTQVQLNKMLDDGKVYAEDFLPKFAKELKKTFESGLPAAAQSMQASINRKNNAILSFKRNTAQLFRPLIISIQNAVPKVLGYLENILPKLLLLKDSALRILNAFTPLTTALLQTGESMGGITGTIEWMKGAMNNLAEVVEIISTGLGTLIQWLQPIAPLIKGIAIVWGVLNVVMAMNPVLATVLAISALIGMLTIAYKKVGWFRGSILAAWEMIKGFGRHIKLALVDRFKELLQGLTGIATAVKHLFNRDWEKAAEAGKKAISNILGVETTKKMVDNAKKTGELTGTAYRKGVIEAAKNVKLAKLKTPKIEANTPANGLNNPNGIFSLQAGAPTTDAKTVTNTNTQLPTTAVSTSGSTSKNQTITIHKFVENIVFQSQKGKDEVESIKKQLEKAFYEITADFENRLLNAQ